MFDMMRTTKTSFDITWHSLRLRRTAGQTHSRQALASWDLTLLQVCMYFGPGPQHASHVACVDEAWEG